ncbi:MAG: hypothetical protein HHAS10_04090 [Candidatus Altimarinota bacterium]
MITSATLPKKDISALTKNRIFAPVILGIFIFVGILFTRPLYVEYVNSKANIMKLESNLDALNNEYESLLTVKNSTDNGSGDLLTKKILEKFDRAGIISVVMFNEFTKEDFGDNPKISIGGISLTDPSRLPNGLSQSTISIAIQGRTIDEIVDYISYITTQTQYAFTLGDISLPIDTDPEGNLPDGYSMSLTFGIYTFES